MYWQKCKGIFPAPRHQRLRNSLKVDKTMKGQAFYLVGTFNDFCAHGL
jgi:hypothetical protein